VKSPLRWAVLAAFAATSAIIPAGAQQAAAPANVTAIRARFASSSPKTKT